MIAAMGTLVFLATLWLLIVLGAAVLEESGATIATALKGQPKRKQAFRLAPVRTRARSRLNAPMRARPRWRDAA
jgi:hypothetical protein